MKTAPYIMEGATITEFMKHYSRTLNYVGGWTGLVGMNQ
jgi:hypothetical protein